MGHMRDWRYAPRLPTGPCHALPCLARGNVDCPAASEATPRRESHRTGLHWWRMIASRRHAQMPSVVDRHRPTPSNETADHKIGRGRSRSKAHVVTGSPMGSGVCGLGGWMEWLVPTIGVSERMTPGLERISGAESPSVGGAGPLTNRGQTWPRPTLLVKSRWSISNAIGARSTRRMSLVSLTFKRRMQDHVSARF
jgi:hypothetical protein